MTVERTLKLIALQLIKTEYHNGNIHFKKFIEENCNLEKLDNDYIPLLKEFLTDYAINNTEKSD